MTPTTPGVDSVVLEDTTVLGDPDCLQEVIHVIHIYPLLVLTKDLLSRASNLNTFLSVAEQVSDVLTVDLESSDSISDPLASHVLSFGLLLHQHGNSGQDTSLFGQGRAKLGAFHGVGLAATSLAVGKDTDVDSVHRCLYKRLDLLENVLLI